MKPIKNMHPCKRLWNPSRRVWFQKNEDRPKTTKTEMFRGRMVTWHGHKPLAQDFIDEEPSQYEQEQMDYRDRRDLEED